MLVGKNTTPDRQIEVVVMTGKCGLAQPAWIRKCQDKDESAVNSPSSKYPLMRQFLDLMSTIEWLSSVPIAQLVLHTHVGYQCSTANHSLPADQAPKTALIQLLSILFPL
jgi:hypothetical protein